MSIILDGSNQTTGGLINAGTAVASTSGTAITFTGIPSTAKRITVMFNGVSTSGTSQIQIQIGSGSVTNTGYVSGSHSSNNADSSSTTGFIQQASNVASTTYSGIAMILLSAANTYTCSGSLQPPGAAAAGNMSGGWITIGGALDRVVITTVNGTDTFDAGSVNIFWE